MKNFQRIKFQSLGEVYLQFYFKNRSTETKGGSVLRLFYGFCGKEAEIVSKKTGYFFFKPSIIVLEMGIERDSKLSSELLIPQ